MVYRVYVEKKAGLDLEAKALKSDIKSLLQIKGVEKVRLFNRYDAEGLSEDLFEKSVRTVFAEPQLDDTFTEDEFASVKNGSDRIFAVEYLPGQFDQRADSAAQCIQIISQKERPTVRTARIYALSGNITDDEFAAIKHHVINPVEAREAELKTYDTLKVVYDCPTTVETIEGFTELDRDGLSEMVKHLGLAMDLDDISFCQEYFKKEKRNPTITEIRMIDTYWSDHCRHTTFLTTIDSVTFEDKELQEAYNNYIALRKELGRTKPVNLMDIATIGARYLKAKGKLPKLDESEEINACTVKIDVDVDGETEKWLLLFKNETHNHPTEIEPFGGAATCIGGAIRDPLSGRSYVYGAMRVTGASNPLRPISETLPGKLPQRKLTYTAAAGYSSYGNQIGLATGIVDELYHDGYQAKRMEIGAVIAAAPERCVRRECPEPGDIVILLGGRTGRDGCGGATGSSKKHTLESLTTCGAEVQKGNAPEERKLQRLFRNETASRLIKRCNDFGAGGVSVAIGELADGLDIDLNAVPKKYDGLDGTELAISESQERMAVVVAAEDKEKFMTLCAAENLEATHVATVTEQKRLVMHWNGVTIVDISREFLNSNGAEKHIDIETAGAADFEKTYPLYTKESLVNPAITPVDLSADPDKLSFTEKYNTLAGDLNVCSKQGLSERFDSTIGAGTVLMPFGGKNQITPIQAMVQKISVEKKHTDTCSLMSWGYNPFITEKSPYHGSYLAVTESIAKLIATGAEYKDIYLTFQEFFEKPMKESKRWGKPLCALLGALKAQLDYEAAAIGGKDSMSGSFEKLDVPPTLVSFAVTTTKIGNIISPEFKAPLNNVYLLEPERDEHGIPTPDSMKKNFEIIRKANQMAGIKAMYTPGIGGIAEAVMKMCFGNGIGFRYADSITEKDIFSYSYGSFIIEVSDAIERKNLISDLTENAKILGRTEEEEAIFFGNEKIELASLLKVYNGKLEPVFPMETASVEKKTYEKLDYNKEVTRISYAGPAMSGAKPKILIPAFPGTNCEFDSAKAARDAGFDPEIIVIKNLTAEAITDSVNYFADAAKTAQAIFLPGGFSGGDEPDGSAKFIIAFLRNPKVTEAVENLLYKNDGLMCGICNGFQALLKSGLLPYGHIIETDENSATLTFNTIGRHQSKQVRTRVCSTKSPWLSLAKVGDIYNVPISHGEGRFFCDETQIRKLAENGQIATQYVDLNGNPTSDILFNPNNSAFAIEGITSPDGRVFGKMGHSERYDKGLYKNVAGNYEINMFKAAANYFAE